MITGTFLDEIGDGLACANWGPEEWRRDFASMKADGIDTVVLERAGCGDRAAFDSRVMRKRAPHLLVQDDLVALFLSLASEHGIALWLGLCDSGEHWQQGRHQKEVDLNRAFADEVWERYGRSAAFRGWHAGHAVDPSDDGAVRAAGELCAHLRSISGLPVLISPPARAGARAQRPFALEAHRKEWRAALAALRGRVDVVAFRDGDVPAADLPDFVASNKELAREQGFASWSRVEASDRGARAEPMPIAWPRLRYRMESALASGAEKLVAFEYSHYLSPHSMYGSAHALHRRYREWLATQR